MPQKLPDPISDQLRQAIDASGLSRYQIAQETGISQAALSQFYNGHRGLAMWAVDALGECLKIKLVLGRKPPQKKSARKSTKGS